jgi:hypothetical protein
LDPFSSYDPSLARFQPTVAGVYQVNAMVSMDNMAVGKAVQVQLFKNGAEVAQGTQTFYSALGTATISYTYSYLISLNGTSDYIELTVFQGDTVARNLTPASHWSSSFIGTAT